MKNKNLPTVSVLIPTLNSASVLGKCLNSIVGQNYPKNKIEIIIADGGSTDKTLKIARKYRVKIYKNPLKTGEAGKAVALKHAKNELVAMIDSDNILPSKNWLQQMVGPFSDSEIIGSEPWKFTYRRQDGFIDRYCALMGVNDPFCYFLGNYDRLNILSGKWTGLPIQQKDRVDWIKVSLKPPLIPTVGANGTILRRKILAKSGLVKDYLFDIDVLFKLAEQEPVEFAKIKTGIIHLYCGQDVKKFARKQRRRIKDYLYYRKVGVRKYPWQRQNKWKVVKFVLDCLTIFPLVYQSVKGCLRKPDTAWFFHPIACWVTLWIYGEEVILAKLRKPKIERKKWRQ